MDEIICDMPVVTHRIRYTIPDAKDGLSLSGTFPKCGNCEKLFGTIAYEYNFCPMCGARWIGEINEIEKEVS